MEECESKRQISLLRDSILTKSREKDGSSNHSKGKEESIHEAAEGRGLKDSKEKRKGKGRKNKTRKDTALEAREPGKCGKFGNDPGSVCQNRKREVDIDAILKFLKQNHEFLCIAGKRLYVFTGRHYEDISDPNKAIAVFKEFLSEEVNRLIRDYMEIYRQLMSDRDIWYNSMMSVNRNRNVIVFENGTYNVLEQKFYEGQFWEKDYVFSIIHFYYDPDDMTNACLVDDFVEQFCDGDCRKRELLWQIVGFCISNYENKKALFYFLGVPDSGKSTLCRFLEVAVGEDAYISVAIKQLNGRFVSGDLEGKKICADEDVAVKTPLKSEDISMVKKITSSDKIRTDAKYQKPGQLHPECKLVWAGNGMLTFETSEDLQPFINRMIIFPLERAVPEEQRDSCIVEKLIEGRNYIISKALEALQDLVDSDFRFTKVVQAERYFTSKNCAYGIDQFVEEWCVLDENGRETMADLYSAYKDFCGLHPEYTRRAINPFSAYLSDKFHLESYNDGESRGKKGIRLLLFEADALTQ